MSRRRTTADLPYPGSAFPFASAAELAEADLFWEELMWGASGRRRGARTRDPGLAPGSAAPAGQRRADRLWEGVTLAPAIRQRATPPTRVSAPTAPTPQTPPTAPPASAAQPGPLGARTIPGSDWLAAPGGDWGADPTGDAGWEPAEPEWIPDADSAEDAADFYSWPNLPAGSTLPDEIVARVLAERGRIVVRTAELKPHPNRKAPTGYSAGGRTFTPDRMFSPEEERNPRLKEILARLHLDLKGEGGTSAVMTGDSARFTWGRGYAHRFSLEIWAGDFLASCPPAKTLLLDLGIALSGRVWKIVDTDLKVVKEGERAIDLVDGREPAEQKTLLLSIFLEVAERFGKEAASAQWRLTKRDFFYKRSSPQASGPLRTLSTMRAHGPPRPFATSSIAACGVHSPTGSASRQPAAI